MSYRTITVNNKVFEYTVGKTHVKIKGVGVWPKEEIGEKKRIPEYCECCGEPLSELYSGHVDQVRLAVAPVHVARKIEAML
jgi:hypothetical protein